MSIFHLRKGVFILPLLPFVLLLLLLIWFIYRRQLQNLVRPIRQYAHYSGAPSYLAGSTSGSPLSELGSHCGFKLVADREAASCSALFATVTSFGAGRLYDFALSLQAEDGRDYFKKPEWRKVRFKPYSIEERSYDSGFTMRSRLFFLQRNLAVYESEWSTNGQATTARPVFALMPTGGRDLENPYPHFNGFSFFKTRGGGLQLSNYHRLPGQKLHALFLPSKGEVAGRKTLCGDTAELAPGRKIKWSVLIAFSANGEDKLVERSRRALRNLEKLKIGAAKRWNNFERTLPVPGEGKKSKARFSLSLAAWALQNSLYAPRGRMQGWGSVPAKVYFPFIWGWDTPQHVLGLSEWNPQKAGEVLLTQLQGNYFAPLNASFKLKIKGISFISSVQRNLIPSKLNDCLRGVLDFYSQPPLQSWAAVRVYDRLRDPALKSKFLQEVLPPLRENLRWWEENRRLKNGFYSYINGLESGIDDSPRFYPPSFLPSFIIGLVPRFFSAVDLNCWLFQSYKNTAYLCDEAGLQEDAARYRKDGDDLGKRIDEELWSSQDQAWLDRRNGKYIGVITPAIWWPAFTGASSSLDKIRVVIENYLLCPDQFWGLHGIPSVAFNDKSYNERKDGYYWRGQIWMINNYSALEVLFRFGYSAEAAQLHDRIAQTLYRSKGMYETYNASTGEVGWSSRGPGDPAVMQFGMSSAWATQILCNRYQHFRYIFPETTELSGHIQWAAGFGQRCALSPPTVEKAPQGALLKVEVPEGQPYDLPKIMLQSRDGRPLLDSALFTLRFEDPAGVAGSAKDIIFAWRGDQFRVKADKSYLIRPLKTGHKLSSA